MRCPWCNNEDTIEVIFGKRTPETIQLEEWGRCVHASKLGLIAVEQDLFYCKKCKKVFSYKDFPPVDTDELAIFFTATRLKFLPSKVKYLILNEAPPAMYMGESPAFFYSNPDNASNTLYEEVITTLFFPPEFVEKTRTVGLSIEKDFLYMSKYLRKFQQKDFFEMDALEYPVSLVSKKEVSRSKLNKLILEEMKLYKEYVLGNIEKIADKDTVIFIIKKSTYDIYYPELSKKYKIANHCLIEKYEKPYIPDPTGHQREFRQKLYECLKSVNYQFEADFSSLKYK